MHAPHRGSQLVHPALLPAEGQSTVAAEVRTLDRRVEAPVAAERDGPLIDAAIVGHEHAPSPMGMDFPLISDIAATAPKLPTVRPR